jgi:hypothetical protein
MAVVLCALGIVAALFVPSVGVALCRMLRLARHRAHIEAQRVLDGPAELRAIPVESLSMYRAGPAQGWGCGW